MNSKNEFNIDIFSLKIFYEKILEILDDFTDGYLLLRDPTLNQYYTVLLGLVDEILQKKDFENLKKEAPQLYESLIGNLEEIDFTWKEILSNEAHDFLGKIEKKYILAGQVECVFPKEFKIFFGNTDKALLYHNKYKKEQWQKMEEVARREDKKIKENFEKMVETKRETPITKVEIVSMPELNIKGFRENVVLPKPKNKTIQLQNFPKNLKWEQISVTFLNGQEVIIKAQDITLQSTYELMGFQDEKRKLPNKQWVLLKLLATQNGELSWGSNNKLTLQRINAIKKQKQLLSENLKAYFQIVSDPFWDYKKEGAYKIKIGLVPENSAIAPSEKDIYGNEDNDDDDLNTQISKSFKRQTPEKYKDEKYNEET